MGSLSKGESLSGIFRDLFKIIDRYESPNGVAPGLVPKFFLPAEAARRAGVFFCMAIFRVVLLAYSSARSCMNKDLSTLG
mmetsp:Transcript_31610/g.73732  ORF Transcript_31610/g.73732 Transcript_31610/m.73732 type:complete len:80 (-) Transcript_31610:391-630(-)